MEYQRSFLKWAGSKYQLLKTVLATLPQGARLIEPFAGSGVVFLNANYPYYVINDINSDLMSVYRCLKEHGQTFINDVQAYFTPENNSRARYDELRAKLNASNDAYERAKLFIYLNRHGYNGLCRYNLRGGFNVPFGRYTRPVFAAETALAFSKKLQKAHILCKPYHDIFALAEPGDVIYCDPPYVCNHESQAFKYFSNKFTLDDQHALVELAKIKRKQGITTIISNHATDFTRILYSTAEHLLDLEAFRSMNRNVGERRMVSELLAVY